MAPLRVPQQGVYVCRVELFGNGPRVRWPCVESEVVETLLDRHPLRDPDGSRLPSIPLDASKAISPLGALAGIVCRFHVRD